MDWKNPVTSHPPPLSIIPLPLAVDVGRMRQNLLTACDPAKKLYAGNGRSRVNPLSLSNLTPFTDQFFPVHYPPHNISEYYITF